MYFFYVDESGNRDPKTSGTKDSGETFEKDHLYVLTAVSLFEYKWKAFEQAISYLKLELADLLRRRAEQKFDLADWEVKSTWVRNPQLRERKSQFLHSLTGPELSQLIDRYYEQLQSRRMQLFSVVVDKRKLKEHVDHHILHKKAYEMLLERIENFLREFHPKHHGLIVMDDTDNGVQLADLCGYNVYRAFKDRDFQYEYFEKMLPFFYMSGRTSKEKRTRRA